MKNAETQTQVSINEQTTGTPSGTPTVWATRSRSAPDFDERSAWLTDPVGPPRVSHQHAGRHRYGDGSPRRESGSAKNKRYAPVAKTLANIRILAVLCAAGAVLLLFWLRLAFRGEFNDQKDRFLSGD